MRNECHLPMQVLGKLLSHALYTIIVAVWIGLGWSCQFRCASRQCRH